MCREQLEFDPDVGWKKKKRWRMPQEVEGVHTLGEGVEHTCLLVSSRITPRRGLGRCWQVWLLVWRRGHESCGTSHRGLDSLDTRHDK